MSLGGGGFLTMDKVLPGTYINFVSASKASANLSERGYNTMPFELDWGVDGEVFEVTNADFQKDSLKIFGYDYTHEKLKGLRDLFLNTKTLYAYRLNSGDKASNEFAKATCSGVRGNDLKIIIQNNVDDESKYDVSLCFGTILVDSQSVSNASELIDNDYVSWIKDSTLTSTSGISLTGGTNSSVDGFAHQSYLDEIEPYVYNIMGVVTEDPIIKQLYINFTKRMRDEVGAKFQLVVHNAAADYEGVINVKNITTDTDWSAASLVYWVTGLEASCAVNKSCLNKSYNGEFTPIVSFTQPQLTKCIKEGEFVLHKVNSNIKVLSDNNSLVTISDTKGNGFKDNQTIRVIDQIANDVALLFATKYLGEVPGDAGGRISLWSDIVKHHEQMQEIRAIQDFTDDHVVVEQGESTNIVLVTDFITVIRMLAQMYMTVKVAA